MVRSPTAHPHVGDVGVGDRAGAVDDRADYAGWRRRDPHAVAVARGRQWRKRETAVARGDGVADRGQLQHQRDLRAAKARDCAADRECRWRWRRHGPIGVFDA